MTLHDVSKRDGLFFAAADPLERALGEIQIFQIGKVLEDGFPDIVGLGAPGAAGQLFKAFFDRRWKPYGQHSNPRLGMPGCKALRRNRRKMDGSC
jgi:hypothetical protein